MDRVELRSRFAKKRIEPFSIPDYGLDLHVVRLSASETAKVRAVLVESQGKDQAGTLLKAQCLAVALGLVDEAGARIYRDDELAAIGDEFPAAVAQLLFDRILVLAGIVPVAEVAKNSSPIPTDASPSA